MGSLETYGAKVTQIKAEVGSVPKWVLARLLGIGLTDNRDEEIIEALKSKKFKVITITHGTLSSSSSQPSNSLTNSRHVHRSPLARCPDLQTRQDPFSRHFDRPRRSLLGRI